MKQIDIVELSKMVAKEILLDAASNDKININDNCKVYMIGKQTINNTLIGTYVIDILEDYCCILKFDIQNETLEYKKVFKAIIL